MVNMIEQKWNYKDHLCFIHIEHELDDSVSKAFHYITKPSGEMVLAPLTPYDCKRSLVEDWIDLGYPARIGCSPLNKWDIKLLQLALD